MAHQPCPDWTTSGSRDGKRPSRREGLGDHRAGRSRRLASHVDKGKSPAVHAPRKARSRHDRWQTPRRRASKNREHPASGRSRTMTDFAAQAKHYLILIEGGPPTNYSAWSPDLPGCVATGGSIEECEREMRGLSRSTWRAWLRTGIPSRHRSAPAASTSAPARRPENETAGAWPCTPARQDAGVRPHFSTIGLPGAPLPGCFAPSHAETVAPTSPNSPSSWIRPAAFFPAA